MRIFVDLDISMEVSLVYLGYSFGDDSEPGVKPEHIMAETAACNYRKTSRVCLEGTGSEHALANVNRLLRTESTGLYRLSERSSLGNRGPKDCWSLHTSLPPEAELSDHILCLNDFLSRNSELVKTLGNQNDALIRCQFETDSDSGGFDIPARALSVPMQLGLSLRFETRLHDLSSDGLAKGEGRVAHP